MMSGKNGDTKLLSAVENGNLKKVKFLLENGADINFSDTLGNTALHLAAMQTNNHPMLKFLLTQKSLILSKENKAKETALDIAKAHGSWRTIGEHIVKRANDATEKPTRKISETIGFVEATLQGDYGRELNVVEAKKALDFVLPALPEGFKQNPTFKLCFQLSENSALYFSLYVKGHRMFYFLQNPGCEPPYYETEKKGGEKSVPLDLDSIKDENKIIHAIYKIWQLARCFNTQCRGQPKDKILKNIEQTLASSKNIEQTLASPKNIKQTLASPENPRETIESATLQLKSARIFVASILHELENTRSKVTYCIQSIEEIATKPTASDLLFSQAKVVLQFLETFALQDVHNVFYPSTAVEAKSLDEALKELKKPFYEKFYLCEKDCPKIIRNFRNFLMHNEKLINLADFKRFVACNCNFVACNCNSQVKIEEFFQCLLEFSKAFRDSVKANKPSQQKPKDCSLLCKFLPKFIKKGAFQYNKSSESFDSIMSRFKENIQKMVEKKESVIDEILFDFVFNLNPKLETGTLVCARLKKIRKIAVHEFQKISQEDLKMELSLTIPELYRQQLAEKVFTKLFEKGNVNQPSSREQLSEILQNVSNMFKDYQTWLPLLTAGESFSLDSHKGGSWPDTERVRQYITYMAPLFDGVDQREQEGENAMSLHGQHNCNLTSVEKLEVFETFIKLEAEPQSGLQNESEHMKTLQQYLKGDRLGELHLDAEYTHNIMNDVRSRSTAIDDSLYKRVQDTFQGLKNLFHGKHLQGHNIPESCAIALYEDICHDRFSLESCGEILKDLNFLEKDVIIKTLTKLCRLDKETEGTIDLGRKKTKVLASKVVLSLMKLSIQKYRSYQVKFSSIDEAFADEVFLQFLLGEVKRRVKEDEHVKSIVDQIKKFDFAPKFVALIIQYWGGTSEIIDFDSLKALTETLFQENSLFPSLVSMLTNKNTEVLKAVTHVLRSITDASNDEIFLLFSTVTNLDMTDNFFSLITNASPARIQQILTAANEVVLENESRSKFQVCLSILRSIQKFEERLPNTLLLDIGTQKIVSERAMIEAKVHCSSGLQALSQRESRENIQIHYVQAQRALNAAQDPPRDQRMLLLSWKAFVESQLFNFEEACRIHRELWSEIGAQLEPQQTITNFENMLEAANFSEGYKRLLATGPEYEKYLHPCSIRNNFLICECKRIKSSGDQIDDKIAQMTALFPEWDKIQQARMEIAEQTKNPFYEYLSLLVFREKAKACSSIARLCVDQRRLPDARFYQYKTLELFLMAYDGFVKLHGSGDWSSQNAVIQLRKSLSALKSTNKSSVAPSSMHTVQYDRCTVCGGTNHQSSQCFHRNKHCSLCRERGHLAKVCRYGQERCPPVQSRGPRLLGPRYQ